MPPDSPGGKAAILKELRQHLRTYERLHTGRGEDWRPERAVLPFGVAALDDSWPDGGLPLGTLHEAAGESNSPGAFAAASAFLASIAGRLKKTVLWCARGAYLYPPGLAHLGLDPAQLIIARPRKDTETLAAMEEGLRCGALGAVIGEIERLDLTASRRLALACEKSGVTALVLRKPAERRPQAAHTNTAHDAIAAASRWRVRPVPSSPHSIPQEGRARWQLELLRSRYGTTGRWIVEAPDAQGYLRLPAVLADRSQTQAHEERRAG
jgi:protein ImuA